MLYSSYKGLNRRLGFALTNWLQWRAVLWVTFPYNILRLRNSVSHQTNICYTTFNWCCFCRMVHCISTYDGLYWYMRLEASYITRRLFQKKIEYRSIFYRELRKFCPLPSPWHTVSCDLPSISGRSCIYASLETLTIMRLSLLRETPPPPPPPPRGEVGDLTRFDTWISLLGPTFDLVRAFDLSTRDRFCCRNGRRQMEMDTSKGQLSYYQAAFHLSENFG